MNEPRTVKVELSSDELALLNSHLRRHLDQVDKELVRTDNPALQHNIAKEMKVLEGVMQRLELLKV